MKKIIEWFKNLFKINQLPPAYMQAVSALTEKANKINDELQKYISQEKLNDETPWYKLAYSMLGLHEVNGVDTPEILEFFKYTSYDPIRDKDLTAAWCAAFMCAMLERTGYKSTGRADAISYKYYGEEGGLRQGAILLLQHPNGGHHVTMLSKIIDDKTVLCLGGNQSNAVRLSSYNRSEIIAVRWPVKKA